MKLNFVFVFLFLLAETLTVQAQKKFDLPSLLQANKITTVNRTATVVEDQKKGIHLEEKSGQGVAWINDATFTEGTIEFDVRGKDLLQKSFVGVAFHAANDSTYEAIYFRPFNFHATDPVRKIHAVQYIFEPEYTWKKLRDERNGIFEKPLLNPPDANGWFHARVEVKGDQVMVFVNDDAQPSLTVTRLSSSNTGKIGLWVGEGSGADFANLTIKSGK